MFKRIYSLLFVGTLMIFTPAHSAPSSASNIKKIVKKDGKIIVIVRENGVDKEIVIDQKSLDKINKDKKKDVKVEKKVTQVEKVEKSKKKVSKKEVAKKVTNKKVVKKAEKKNKVKVTKKSIKKVAKTAKVATKKSNNVKGREYKVVEGDTIFSIARKYKVSISSLLKLNKVASNSLIHPGDLIKIPKIGYVEATKRAVATNKKTIYRVKSGDTLSLIAKMYSMKISKLRSLNNLKRNPKLKPGMELSVIGKAKVLKSTKRVATKHRVKRGDTLWAIARKYNLTVSQLKALNPRIRSRGLRRGLVLNVSKAKAIKITKLAKKRKSRLKGLLSRYNRRGGKYNSRTSRNVVAYAKRFLGTRYVWGASRPGAFDCSGFTQYVMKRAKGRSIPRVSRRQAYYGRYVSRRNLRAGDLIFFDTSRRRRGYVNHVGIYIGNGRFIHASSGKHRVVITSLNKPFYRSRFLWGRRVN